MTRFPVIAPPAATALRTNLIRASRRIDAAVPWERYGVAYQPLEHGNFDDTELWGTFDPCSPTDIDVDDAPAAVDWETVGLWTSAKCSAMGGDDVFAETVARARTRLTNQESHILERAFWTGEVGGVASGNRALAAATADVTQPLGTTPTGIVPAFAALIEAMADQLGGERGFIHVPAKLGPYLGFYGLAKVDASGTNVVTMINDHVVVVGTGYPGTGPDGAAPATGAAWIYATSPVEVGLGAVSDSGGDRASMIDRSDNTVVAIAQRPAIAHFDEQVHVGVQVCLPDPGPECPVGS